jgi:hypothetical protein
MVVGEDLHPAQRRRVAAQMPALPDHDVHLRPLGGGDARTIIATSSAQDFVAGLLEDLAAADWAQRISRMRRLRKGQTDDVLELYQPIHRRFQIALFEAYCVQPGSPRLDPAKINDSGLVIRRLRNDRREGWMKRGKSIDGWTRIDDPNADPDPAKAAVQPANLAIREAIAARQGKPQVPAAETVHGLYPAPPEVCEAIGKTVLFAAIPVCSAETSDAAADAIDYNALQGQDRTDMVLHLSAYLKDRPEREMPRKQEVLSADWNVLDAATIASDNPLSILGTFLHQMTVELDALGPGAASAALMTVLAEISLPLTEDIEAGVTSSVSAADFVRKAGPILIGREVNSSGFAMPIRWPAVDTDVGGRLTEAALACLSEQYKARVGPPGKFADDNAQYVVRGFMRVAGHEGCPDKLVWSMESEGFRILPWWDGDGPGTSISLPSIGKLKSVKPSVAFSMPPEIANLFKGDLTKVADGDAKEDTSGIAWLCSFSIPFITICAFICLNIFLGLFDLIFRWMMWIKICIPIPKSGK